MNELDTSTDDEVTPELAERRMIMARLGKMAALTTPGLITLLLSNRASAASADSLTDVPNDPVDSFP